MSKNYEELSKELDMFDPVVQMQIDSFTSQMRKATASECCIGICETDKSVQISISTTGPDETKAQAHSLVVLCQCAAGAIEQKSGGKVKLILQLPDGSMVPALPENLNTVMTRRPRD